MLAWIICLLLSGIFLCLTIYSFFMNTKGNFERIFVFLICCGFFVYFPHYLQTYSIINAILANIVNLLQIITVNSNSYEELQATIPSGMLFHICILIRGIVHVFCPLASAYVVFSFVYRNIRKIRLKLVCRGRRNIYVFSCFNENAEMIMKDIYANDKKAVFVLYENDKIPQEIDYTHIVNIKQSMLTKAWNINLRHKDIYYFNIYEEGDKNINKGLELINAYAGEKRQEHIHIYIFSEVPEIDDMILDTGDKGNIDIRIIDKYRLAAYKLLMEKPLYHVIRPEKNVLSVLIVDFGKIGREILSAALWNGQLLNVRLKINIITKEKEKNINYIQMYYPEVLDGEYDINFWEVDIDSVECESLLKAHCRDTNYVIVCRENDSLNLQTALFLRKYFYKADGCYFNKPFIALYINSDERNIAIKNIREKNVRYDLYPFGSNMELYTYQELIESKLENLARNVHLAYAEIFQVGKVINIKEELRNYNRLEVTKKSNRAAALNLQYKLWQIGYEYTEEDVADERNELVDYLKMDELEDLARVEHDRWMAFYRTEGWSAISIEEAKTEGYQKLSNNGKSALLMLHPDICPYEEIKGRCEMLSREDTTKFDKLLIQYIPDIVGDKWGVMGKKYKIRKLK